MKSTTSIGIIGTYTLDNIPTEISNRVSYGLIGIGNDGKPFPLAASSYKINDNGKTYQFRLKKGLHFSDGKKLTSSDVNYNFSDVLVERPSEDTIIFKLKSSYSPFLVTVSRPIFRNNFVGLGEYKIKNINLNGNFLDSIDLASTKNGSSLKYQFYPTENALKMALLLGEINYTDNISDPSVLGVSLSKFNNEKITKKVNYNKLVTLFYDTQNKNLSDKRLREALSYTLPNYFSQGERIHTPYPPNSWVSKEQSLTFAQDIDHARLLLDESNSSGSAKLTIKFKTLKKYENIAKDIRNAWNKLGIKTEIETVEGLPFNFDVFLGEFYVSKDPDQYVLWHSSQQDNISHYKNLRIDKLLEDGRQVTDTTEREKIYSDFQKYLLDDPPASFLFFPYNYSVSK